jgi:hypothetical protein
MKNATILLALIIVAFITVKAQTHDLGVNQVLPESIYYGDSAKIFPAIRIYNYGTEEETDFEVEVTISNGVEIIYNCTEIITENIAVDEDMFVTMNQVWVINDPIPTYTIEAQVTLIGDENADNDNGSYMPYMNTIAYPQQIYGDISTNPQMEIYDFNFFDKNGNFTLIYEDVFGSGASDFINGILYRIGANTNYGYTLEMVYPDGTFIVIGPEQGTANNVIRDNNGELLEVHGFAYNYNSNIAYFAANVYLTSNYYLYKINLQTLEVDNIADLYHVADLEYADGKLYAIRNYDNSFSEINMQTGETTYIGALGQNLLNDQAMSYDRNKKIMYALIKDWVYEEADVMFGTIDIQTGHFNEIKNYEQWYYAPKSLNIQPTPLNNIISFQIPDQIGETIINNNAQTITVTMPIGTNVSNLTPEIITSDGTMSPPGNIPRDFTNPVEYTITGKWNTEKIWTATVDIFTSTDEINQNNFTIYPNPSNGIFTVTNNKLQITDIEIIDLAGKIIQYSVINGQYSINKNGIYLIKIKTETGIYTEKLVIQ